MTKTNFNKLARSLANFTKTNEALAKKYGCKISIGFNTPTGKTEEIVLADHRKDKEDK